MPFVAGASAGEVEERQAVISEVTDPTAISCLIDEMHTLESAWQRGRHGCRQPAQARPGAASCTPLGPPRLANTRNTFGRRTRPSNAVLMLMVDEPTIEDAISIMRGIKESVAPRRAHHRRRRDCGRGS
jgi:ATP-dependent Clp protease ATP-binding subunit ClpA